MVVYRIERLKYLSSTLSGWGAALSTGFRWNSLNTRMVYTAATRSLAMLEVSVHLDWSEDLPLDRYVVEIELPDDLVMYELQPEDLPIGWDVRPPGTATQFIGDDFVIQNKGAVLRVPSCIIPEEYNYLLNPMHEDFNQVKIIGTRPLLFDVRWKNINT